MAFFDRYPGVMDMLEQDRQAANRLPHGPYRVMSLSLGRPRVEESFDTEQEARDALAAIHRTCAPFVRDAIWLEGPQGRLR